MLQLVPAMLALKTHVFPQCRGTTVASGSYGCDEVPDKADCAEHISCPSGADGKCYQCGISSNGQCLHESMCLPAPVASLRDDYRAYTFAAGAKADFASPSGLGTWSFAVSDKSKPGAGTETVMEYAASAHGVRAGNSFITPNSKSAFDLPAIGTKTGVVITPESREGKADANSLALHPGNDASHKFLLVKFKAARAVDVAGYANELGAHCGGIDVWMFNGATEICSKNGLNSGGAFTFTETTVAAGSTLTVVIGPNGGFSCDHSSLSLTMKKLSTDKASLRDDYRAYTFAAGAKADFASPSGLGTWSFAVSDKSKPGAGTETVMEYAASAHGVRAGNSFITPNSKSAFDLPAIGTKTGVVITPESREGKADANSLALHPGNHASHKFLLVKFKAARAVDVAGYANELGAHCGGIDVWMFNGATEICSKNGLNSGGAFTFTKTTVAAGSTLTVVIGPNGGFSCDHSSLSLTMKKKGA